MIDLAGMGMWSNAWIAVMAAALTAMWSLAPRGDWPFTRFSLPLRVLVVNPCLTAGLMGFALLDTSHPPSPRMAYVIALASCAAISLGALVGVMARHGQSKRRA